MISTEKVKRFFKSFFKEYWKTASGVWLFGGMSTILDLFEIIHLFQNNWFVFLVYIIIIILIPIIIYDIFYYEKKIEIIIRNIQQAGRDIIDLYVYNKSETVVLFKIIIGENVNDFFIFFLNFPEIDYSFNLDNPSFQQVYKKISNYSIIKCSKQYGGSFLMTVTILNRTQKSFKRNFTIYISKKKPFKKAMKWKKKVETLVMHCNPSPEILPS